MLIARQVSFCLGLWMSGCLNITLARFVVEVIAQPDLSSMVKSYRGSGAASYHPSLFLACWFTVTPRVCFRAGSWSVRPTIPWRFVS